jgi:predicted nucleotidyltransferase
MILDKLQKKNLISPPPWLVENTHYITMMGSEAYGCSSGSSDIDLYGFCIPRKVDAFPHLKGEIFGFGRQTQRFEQYQQHHIKDESAGKEYDITVYSIIKYFQLLMENNPNILDSIYTPRRCILHVTPVGEMVRENRKLFLHKGSYHKFRGYFFQQLHKIRTKVNSTNERRAKDIETFGLDLKYSYHVVRLGLECEQILSTHDLNLERDREVYKSIRRGEWTIEKLEEWASEKEKHLEKLYTESTLAHVPDEAKIKQLLINCLEHHYGTLQDAVKIETSAEMVLDDLEKLLIKYRGIK